jgi:PAS domain-containing protein
MDNPVKDSDKSRDQLLEELNELRQRVVELEASEAGLQRVDGALRASEVGHSPQRLRQVIQSMPVMLLALDEERQTIIAWNHESERVTGYSAGEIIGDPPSPGVFIR